jgi:hypothetical protein
MLHLLLLSLQASPLPPAELAALHHRRAEAAEVLHTALALTNAGPVEERMQLARAADRAADLEPGADAAAFLRAAARLGLGSLEPETGHALLRSACAEAADRLAFTPVYEAPVPEGYPSFTPLDEVLILEYPELRLARTDIEFEGAAFWRLFQHIESGGIAMTAPVQIDYGPPRADGSSRPRSMAFLYDRKDRGPSGAQGGVEVLDQPSLTVISTGLRGWTDPVAIERAELLLRGRLEVPGSAWRTAGPTRVLGYNSPMVGGPRRFYEVQIPVAPAASLTE